MEAGMVRIRAENGSYFHEPPYTEEEEFDFYRRVAGGPLRVLHGTAKERIAPAMQREMIIDLIYELCSDLLPEDDKSLPPEVEHKIVAIHRYISYALGIDPEVESI
jgi:hypothetical protein